MKNKLVQGTDRVAQPFIYVSEFDLVDEDIQECIKVLGFDEVLYGIGFDKNHHYVETDSFYEIIECTHKTRTGKTVTGKRYTGYERVDEDWILNGLPSDEAKIAARKDNSYIAEIRNLSKRSKY